MSDMGKIVAKNILINPKKLSTVILKRKDISGRLWLMWIEKPKEFSFKAGQYCSIGTGNIERPYSISSSPHEETLELFVELVPPPEGNLTPLLWQLSVGDTVTIRPRAKGRFVFNPKLKNQLMISTVTGIVPYVSILREYVHNDRNEHVFHVLQGVSYKSEFAYDGELTELASIYPDFIKYIATISRPNESANAGWHGATGRVNDLIDDYIYHNSLSPEDTIIYACGHPQMIEIVKDKFIPQGFQIEQERFWKEDD